MFLHASWAKKLTCWSGWDSFISSRTHWSTLVHFFPHVFVSSGFNRCSDSSHDAGDAWKVCIYEGFCDTGSVPVTGAARLAKKSFPPGCDSCQFWDPLHHQNEQTQGWNQNAGIWTDDVGLTVNKKQLSNQSLVSDHDTRKCRHIPSSCYIHVHASEAYWTHINIVPVKPHFVVSIAIVTNRRSPVYWQISATLPNTGSTG